MLLVFFKRYFVADLLKNGPYHSVKSTSLGLLEKANSPIFRIERTAITVN